MRENRNQNGAARMTAGCGEWAVVRLAGLPFLVAALAGAGGCGTDAQLARPLTAESFAAPPTDSRGIGNPLDRPGPVNYDQVRLVSPAPPNANRDGAAGANNGAYPNGGPVRDIGKTVERTIRPPADIELPGSPRPSDVARADATTDPRATPRTLPSATEGGFDYIGFVLMEVNGQPIYVDKVLKSIEKPLEAEAKHNGPDQFREIAKVFLKRQIQWFEREELEFAMAQRMLPPADEFVARALTIDWRQKQITAAGGSLELAKRKAAADGWDFEELTRQTYRLKMIQLYYTKRILPQVFVPRRDIWEYYVANKDKVFTTHGQVRFRVIQIDPRKYPGGKDEAYARAKEVISRATQEKEDFAALARRFNDDPGWVESSGRVGGLDGWVQKGAFRLQEVEEAVWKLRPGQVSDIIPAGGAFYVAKLEEVKEGKVQGFEDAAVQERIREELRSRQLTALRDAHVQKLKRDAATRENPGMDVAALNMLMGRYPQWASAK